jgi:hypothetical protein
MPGPPPKDPALRVRRNKVATRASIGRAAPAKKRTLPPRKPAWHAEARRTWDDWWRSPEAAEWTQVHVSGLLRVIVLVDDFWRATTSGERKAIAAEIRLQGAEFGLSPLAKRRLQWERIHQEDEETAAAKPRVAPPAPPPSGDPRLRLVKQTG